MSDDFTSRLESAIQRGRQRAEHQASEERRKELSEEELKRLHTSYRLSLSENIETAVHRVADHFPGFRNESVFGEEGWGTACYRDDLRLDAGRRTNLYSRLELVIRPYSDLRVLDLKGKGTVMNREIFNRSHYMKIAEVDPAEFAQLIDTWAIEYAELYASKSSI
ncbi:hypothetical protein SAMN06265222_102360 [Neorhodopirellula lusitana]|uniref:DUF5655 domain-containing protein n=1 Tax=Neorhodopirellula lusitana TaxID=445327 RepID=A0ABY1PTZ7_9BACT|nr:hypothetical protein [Neorhodopirellula lusitana]SMP47911.1 hypothetical protein SAMN06265222_102360 [Neorhodopirellula lusitana]